MNQFFSFKRFGLLVPKHGADHKKRYGLSVLAFIGLLITWFVLTSLANRDRPMGEDVQRMTYFFALFVAGTFYASQAFRDLGSKAKGTNFILVPASTFEKLLCGLLFTVVLFFAVFTIAFYAVDLLMIAIAPRFMTTGGQGASPSLVNMFGIDLLQFSNGTSINFLMVFFAVQAAFLLGSAYFKKYSFIKTVIAGFAAGFIVFCLTYFLCRQVLPPGDFHKDFLTAYRVHVDGTPGQLVEVPGWIGQVFPLVPMYALAPFLWVVAYYRLKEKQV